MKELRAEGHLPAFWMRLAAAPARLLLLDYDGVLAPFHENRHAAVPHPGVREALQRLMPLGTCRVVIISGREAADVARLIAMNPHPEIWGSHGWERMLPGERAVLADLPPQAAEALKQAHDAVPAEWAAKLEAKPAGLAFHVRGLPDSEAQARLKQIQALWAKPIEIGGLEALSFDGGLELRVPGRTKGHAVDALLEEAGTGAVAAYLGDDLTDEDAFRHLGTRGLSVLVREMYRDTLAALWLTPPEELLDFFAGWELACHGNPPPQ